MVSLIRFSDLGSRVARWLARLAVAVVALAFSSTAFAQGCAMCYNSARAAKAAALQALRSGVLILLVPPLLMFIGIFVFAYRNRNRFADEYAEDAALEREWREWLAQPEPVPPNFLENSRPEEQREIA